MEPRESDESRRGREVPLSVVELPGAVLLGAEVTGVELLVEVELVASSCRPVALSRGFEASSLVAVPAGVPPAPARSLLVLDERRVRYDVPDDVIASAAGGAAGSVAAAVPLVGSVVPAGFDSPAGDGLLPAMLPGRLSREATTVGFDGFSAAKLARCTDVSPTSTVAPAPWANVSAVPTAAG